MGFNIVSDNQAGMADSDTYALIQRAVLTIAPTNTSLTVLSADNVLVFHRAFV